MSSRETEAFTCLRADTKSTASIGRTWLASMVSMASKSKLLSSDGTHRSLLAQVGHVCPEYPSVLSTTLSTSVGVSEFLSLASRFNSRQFELQAFCRDLLVFQAHQSPALLSSSTPVLDPLQPKPFPLTSFLE